MYYAVKKVINSNPEALERQYVEDYAELSNDPQYADLTKEEKRARSAYAICTILILPAFVAATALSVSPPAHFPFRIHSVGSPDLVCHFCPQAPQQKERGHQEKERRLLQSRSLRI